MNLLTASDFTVCVTIYYTVIEENTLQPNYKRNALSMSKGFRRYFYW